MNADYKPGPVTTRPLNDEEREYFRKRQRELKKHPEKKTVPNKKWGWTNPYGR